jgi:hydrogenase maturation protease
MQTECLVRASEAAEIEIRVRFLQCIARKVGKLRTAASEFPNVSAADFEIVESLRVGGKDLQSWQEAKEREVTLGPLRVADLLRAPARELFTFLGSQELESIKDDSGNVEALIVRTSEAVNACVAIRAVKVGGGVFRLSVVLSNLTEVEDSHLLSREDALLRSLLSAHTVLGVSGGEFISQIDPPQELQREASQCKNVGTWPVMVGEQSARDSMLSSPIILYDYPQIAPESQGDLFDGTEIDEILALRILTLSDDEKCEIRQSDARARDVLERTESMPAEHFMKLHGVLRGMTAADSSATAALAREEER